MLTSEGFIMANSKEYNRDYYKMTGKVTDEEKQLARECYRETKDRRVLLRESIINFRYTGQYIL